MTRDESRQPGGEPSRPEEPDHASSGPISITTTDPVIDSAAEHQADWKAHPDRTMHVETTQTGEPGPSSVSGVRTVDIEDEPRHRGRQSDDAGRLRERRGGPDHRSDRDRSRPPMSMTKSLLLTAGVARIVAAASRVYALHGDAERLRGEHPDCGHDFPQQMRKAAYGLFDAVLR